MSDTRVLPYSEVRLYNPGQGDPRVTDYGFGWYDILAQSWPRGTFQYDSRGVPLLELLPEIGLVCRPFFVAFDTRLTQYTLVHGAWDESRPGTGTPRVYRLVQGDSTPGVVYSATSNFSLPQNPSVMFALSLPDTPGDWDETTLPPYVSVEFGGGAWRLFFSKSCNQLQRKVSGLWTSAGDIQAPASSGDYEDEDNEVRLLLRCLRGKVGISADGGRSYTWAANPDGSAITVPGAPLVLRGQGGECSFGLWQILYQAGTYDSPARDTLRSRISPVATFTPRALAPTGTSVNFSDLSTPAAGLAQYRATLTPRSTPGVPFAFWATPELYAVGFRYPVVSVPGDGSHATPWADCEMKWDVEEPLDLAQASANLEVLQPAETEITESYDWRRVEIYAGATQESGDPTADLLFTGYVGGEPGFEQADFGQTRLRLPLECAAARFRRTKWSALDVAPLGGLTVNQALDYVLASEGLNSSYRAWHVFGDRLTLPLGTPEDPFELIKPNEAKWDTMARIAGYVNLELGATRDGTYTAVPLDFVAETEHTYTPTGDTLLGTYDDLSHQQKCGERATAVLVTGTDNTGATLLAWALDAAAEDPDSDRFIPWRVLKQEDLSGACDLGVLTARAQALAYQCFDRKREPAVQLPVDLSLSRRDRVIVNGEAGRGIPDGTAHVILSLKHSYSSRGNLVGLKTSAGLRRIDP